MKRKLWAMPLILLLGLSIFFIVCNAKTRMKEQEAEQQQQQTIEDNMTFRRLRVRAESAEAYCKEKGFNTKYCFLVDFSIHSGKNRFFIWDFAKDSIMEKSLCAHGYGLKSTQTKPVYSNVEGSYCSSLGRYKIGVRSYSQWGINVHYKMHGLDKTNSNAFKRWVVLHSHTPVAEREIYPTHLPLGYSQGCPVISNGVMRKVDEMLKETKKPVLLWIFN